VQLATGVVAGGNAGELSLRDALDLAHAAGGLVSGARPLADADLTHPDHVPVFTADVAELRARADRAEARLRALAGELRDSLATDATPELVADLLARAALCGVPHSIPGAGGTEDLLDQARAVERLLARRFAELEQAAARIDVATAPPDAQQDHELARMATLFGPGLRVLPRLRPVQAAELAEAFAGSVGAQGGDPFAAPTFLANIARLRPAVDRLNTALCYAEALGGGAPGVHVAQLPLSPQQLWAALPQPGGVQRDGGLSLIATMPEPLDADAPVAGFWIDEWIEVVPAADVTTGIAFNFDEPAAQAPNVILLAVPPDESPTWDLAALEAIVLETLALAKIRAVGPETLDQHTDLGRALPALYFTLNLKNDTVSTDFRRLLAAPS
jgi:hypothetical protein